jgi:DHA1 family bicyclomycin/chloramphenicol resistance-like MFS transporter
MDVFLPALPAIARHMSASPGAAQAAVTAYLAGLAAGQLAWGPVSDRFGRRPVLLFGLLAGIAASAAGAFAQSLESLGAARFVQGIAIACGPVIARSVVRDLYARDQAAQLLARMTLVFGLVPILAPLAGAQAVGLAGWPATLWFIAAVCAALFLGSALGLAETAAPRRGSLAPARLAATYATLLSDRRFAAPLATALSTQLGIIAFVSHSPLVGVNALGLSAVQFSVLFAAIMLGQVCASYAASRLAGRWGMARTIRTGAALAAAGGAALAAAVLGGLDHWSTVLAPMLLYVAGGALVIPAATAAALSPFPAMAGAASSLLGALPFAVGSVMSALLGLSFDGTAMPMACAVGACGLCVAAAERWLCRPMLETPPG